MNDVLLLVVVAISAALGAVFAVAFLHWRIAALLDRSLAESDEQLRAVQRLVSSSSSSSESLAQLEMEDKVGKARQEGAREPMEQVLAPGAHARNDALAHAMDAPGARANGFPSPSGRPWPTSREKRPCVFCDRVRAFFAR